jgi:hypothetical protein
MRIVLEYEGVVLLYPEEPLEEGSKTHPLSPPFCTSKWGREM